MQHEVSDLITIFNLCFLDELNTILVKGDDEPIYLPHDSSRPHNQIVFAHGFFASALHECAHWLVAGAKRRELIDFGYWYEPDGRTVEQQKLFQVVEVKPQAIEWILSQACGFKFRVSSDNLNGETCDTEKFKYAIYEQVKSYCQNGLNSRALKLRSALAKFYKIDPDLKLENFILDDL